MNTRSRILGGALSSLAIACGLACLAVAESRPADLSDSDLERVLRKGKIIKREDIGTGVTKPMRFWLELDGITVSASYKDVDYEKRGVTRLTSGNAEFNFTDSYRYERAAYLLDRELGLGMVPVTVIRQVYREPGAVTLWIGDSITETERIEQRLRPPDMANLVYQQADMRLFDALIYNTDRHAGNQLFTLDDWQLHLIDHSRAFRTRQELPEMFHGVPMTVSRPLLARLEALTKPQVKKLLKRELGPAQIDSILARRDLILEKLEKDRLEYGDAFAYRDEQPVP